MKRKLSLLVMLLFVLTATATAQEKRFACYAVGFYNQENLFDTIHDEGKNDYEFLPGGSYKWNTLKYTNKLKNMARALADIGTDRLPGIGASIIGLAEVENDRVLDDLTAQAPLKERGYKYVHIEGPDQRGIDCALLYNPRFFTPESQHLYPYIYEKKDSAHATRGFLTVTGRLAGEDITVIVCHWPSRFATSYYRERAGAQVKVLKDSLLAANPGAKIFIMGDMNDDPTNKSMAESLGAREEIKDVGDHDMYNPWWDILAKQGRGTLFYQGGWNLFDQIVLSPNLLNRDGKKDFSTLKFFKNEIVRRDYLIQQDGKYKGSPLRTSGGGAWLNGFSDHLPVVVYLVKEVH
jgi:hypothetical protein